MKIYYNNVCPNCSGRISNERLIKGLPCENDYPYEEGTIEQVYEYLKENNKLKDWANIYNIEKAKKEFEEFFYKAVNNKPWSAQRAWFIRAYKGYSFSIIAPTGMGKTTFALVNALYWGKKGKKVYIIVPTRTLVKQLYEKINVFAERVGFDNIIVAYYGNNKQKKEAKELIKDGAFSILITSNQFLSRNFDLLKNNYFDIIFADDVDSIMKSSKNIDRILYLLGFSETTIEKAMQLIKLKISGKDLEKIRKMEEQLKELVRKEQRGILIAASATGSMRGLRVKLFRELLGFEVGAAKTTIRNIIDVYTEMRDYKKQTLELIKKLGNGGLVFVPTDYGIEKAEEIAQYLKENNIKAEAFYSGKSIELLDKYANKELDVLVGVAHYYGLIVRGIDLPHVVKYAIFVGIPRFRFSAKEKETKIGRILLLASTLSDYADEEFKKKLNTTYNMIKRVSTGALKMVEEAIEQNKELDGFLEELRKNIIYLRDKSFELINREDIIKKLEENPFIALERGDGINILIPDVKTYIQASGRTSRMYPGGITKGLSIILSDNEKLLRALEFKLKLLGIDLHPGSSS